MNDTNIPKPDPPDALRLLAEGLTGLTREARKAGAYVLENPNAVSVSSVRELARAAQVKPNTIVRMARSIGFEGYEDFRQPFREAVRNGTASFPDRARWLQSVRQKGELGALYAGMITSALDNIETTFGRIGKDDLESAARMLWTSRQVFTLGVGVNAANAQNFSYLASTGMVRFHAIPRPGGTASDDLAWASEKDVLIAITCKPYRREVIEAVQIAREQGVGIIGISDGAASPVITTADHGFVVCVDTPQFFPSSVSIIALLETLMSFVVAIASPDVVERVEKFHQRRHALGMYQEEFP